jgi:hypothetical protein
MVGKEKQSLTLMDGSDFRSRKSVPDRIIPALGQVSEYSAKVPVSKEPWDVLQEDVAGFQLANGTDGLGPHVALVVLSSVLSGNGPRLTREAG